MAGLRFAVTICLGALLACVPRCAHADILPADACPLGAKAGDRCANAGSTYDRPGRCVATTCRHPNPLAPGGGIDTPCLICTAQAGSPSPGTGSSGAGGATGEDRGTSDAGGTSDASPRDDRVGWLAAGLLVMVGAGAMLVARRRR